MSLKDYQILNKLGSGSFGIVYKVKRKDNGQISVIKEVQLKSMDKRMKQWAMNEVKIMKNINSPHIVKYFQSFVQKEKLYICMEYCSGGDLAQYLKGQMGKPLPEDTLWRFAIQIMLGLRDLHNKKILHRDIKTMNVFLLNNKEVRIGDLGVARTLTGEFANTVVGTPYYLSPQMCEQKPYNEKTDVWAMGCLIYQLCTGKHPFEGNNQAALAIKIIMGKYAPIPAFYSQVTVWLVKSCLSVDYKRRPTIQYILNQTDVIKMANKLGIPLDSKAAQSSKEIEVKLQSELLVKPAEKIEKGGVKAFTPKSNEPKVLPKKNYFVPKVPERKSSRQKSIEKSKEKVNQTKGSKKQLKPNLVPKGLPAKRSDPKKSQPSVQIKKPELNIKRQNPNVNKSQELKLSAEKDKKPSFFNEKSTQKKKIVSHDQKMQKPQKKIEEAEKLPLMTKPKKSVQEIVDDDELFKDFGITPEKLSVMHDKVQFKKVNTINWNVCEESESPNEKSTLFKELPTIRTPSNCELLPIECKQIQGDEDLVAQEIDDNAPYRSDEQIPVNQDDEESLLIESDKDIQEDSQLKKREKLLMLEKKIFENQKRRKELVQLKNQWQNQLLMKMDRSKLDQIIKIIKEGTDQQIEKIALKELNSAGGTNKFYRIFYRQIEIERCQETISKCKESIIELSREK